MATGTTLIGYVLPGSTIIRSGNALYVLHPDHKPKLVTIEGFVDVEFPVQTPCTLKAPLLSD